MLRWAGFVAVTKKALGPNAEGDDQRRALLYCRRPRTSKLQQSISFCSNSAVTIPSLCNCYEIRAHYRVLPIRAVLLIIDAWYYIIWNFNVFFANRHRILERFRWNTRSIIRVSLSLVITVCSLFIYQKLYQFNYVICHLIATYQLRWHRRY